jgi:hypothetical protein
VRPALLLTLGAALSIVACTSSESSKPSDANEETEAKCTEPENPYSAGSGHYAGYEWAEEKGAGTCSGSSQSFNEGCEEYEQQETAYEECQARMKK